MRLYRCVLFAVALVLAAAPSAHSFDMAKVTCRTFAASGYDNMAAVIMWLRGYHADRTGIVITVIFKEVAFAAAFRDAFCGESHFGKVVINHG
jgi:HdeA/HdeB family